MSMYNSKSFDKLFVINKHYFLIWSWITKQVCKNFNDENKMFTNISKTQNITLGYDNNVDYNGYEDCD